MKIVNAILGALITLIILMGVMFKIMHWPGASEMIIFGASSLSIYIIPVAIGNVLSYKNKTLIGICNGIGAFGGMILSIGLLFKIMHWPGAGIFMMIGMAFSTIVFFFFMILFITSKESIKLSPGTFFTTICFGLLIYTVSLGSSSRSRLIGIVENSNRTEHLIHQAAYEIDIHATKTPVATKLHQGVNKLKNHIDNLKTKLYQEVDILPIEIADTISLEQISGKDNYDIPTYILGLTDPDNPYQISGLEPYSAITLKEQIQLFNNILNESDSTIEPIKTEVEYYYSRSSTSWEAHTFYHKPLAQIILILNQIELEAIVKANLIIVSKTALPQN